MAKDPARLKTTRHTIKMPFYEATYELETNATQRRAAWSLYVELVTRVSLQPLPDQQGLLRETLISLHSLFASTREILKEAGPDIGGASNTVGGIALIVLNRALRPFLSKWHPQLQSWEATRATGADPFAHENGWSHAKALRDELEVLRGGLADYADILAEIAGAN